MNYEVLCLQSGVRQRMPGDIGSLRSSHVHCILALLTVLLN